MVYRDRQEGPPPGDPMSTAQHHDHYLDNCFLLCLNRDDQTDVPEIHRLENHLLRDLCQSHPVNKSPSQQQSRRYVPDQRRPMPEKNEFDEYPYDERNASPRYPKENDPVYRRKDNQADHYPESQAFRNRSRYPRDPTQDSYYTQDHPDYYSRAAGRFQRQDDYNIMQHSDDELSVYEVYVPTNTLNRLSDKRIDNNMVLIDYEDASMDPRNRGPASAYGPSSPYPRVTQQGNGPAQYENYAPMNPYGDRGPYDPSMGYPKGRGGAPQSQPNHPMQQQRWEDYYGNQRDPYVYSPQSGPFVPTNPPVDHANAINVRRHLYSPSQLPQGLTEGQLVMLLQKGNQHQQTPAAAQPVPVQSQPIQTEIQPSTSSAVNISRQASPTPSVMIEPTKSPEYVPPVQIQMPPMLPQIMDHRLMNDEKSSVIDDLTKPMSTLNTTNSIKPPKDIELKENGEKKKDKTSDAKKDKKAEKDGASSKKDGKKDGKKDKSSGKDAKKKKK